MSYWSGTFNFEYNSFDMDDYLECTDGKDTYVIDFGVECTAYAEGREDSGSWDEPPSADIDEVTLEDMEFYYCVAYKKTDDIDDIFDIVGEEELGYVIVNKNKGLTQRNCDAEARKIWDKIPIYNIVEEKMQDYAYDISGEADYDYF